jgi:hypothetical protein
LSATRGKSSRARLTTDVRRFIAHAAHQNFGTAMPLSGPSQRQGLNLEQVLLWFLALASILLALTLINYVWPFANPNQPAARLRIGLMYDLSAFSFAIVAYSLLRAGWLKSCLALQTRHMAWAFCFLSLFQHGRLVFVWASCQSAPSLCTLPFWNFDS